jgi:hypothetical protein
MKLEAFILVDFEFDPVPALKHMANRLERARDMYVVGCPEYLMYDAAMQVLRTASSRTFHTRRSACPL